MKERLPKAFITYAQVRPAKYFRLLQEYYEAARVFHSASPTSEEYNNAAWKIIGLRHEIDHLIGP